MRETKSELMRDLVLQALERRTAQPDCRLPPLGALLIILDEGPEGSALSHSFKASRQIGDGVVAWSTILRSVADELELEEQGLEVSTAPQSLEVN